MRPSSKAILKAIGVGKIGKGGHHGSGHTHVAQAIDLAYEKAPRHAIHSEAERAIQLVSAKRAI